MFGPEREKVRGSGKDYILRSDNIKKGEMDGPCGTQGGGGGGGGVWGGGGEK